MSCDPFAADPWFFAVVGKKPRWAVDNRPRKSIHMMGLTPLALSQVYPY
jgi:hypothetical protein